MFRLQFFFASFSWRHISRIVHIVVGCGADVRWMWFDIVDVENPSIFFARTNVIYGSVGYKSTLTILLSVVCRITEGEMVTWSFRRNIGFVDRVVVKEMFWITFLPEVFKVFWGIVFMI